MKLIQLFLPVYDQHGKAFPKAYFDQARSELTGRFGGVTAFLRSPAVGAWQEPGGEICRDDVYLYEVLADALDRGWWQAYRARLERQFSQDVILVRVTDTEVL
jgi:hypothetical protein